MDLVTSPDKVLMSSEYIAATADSVILDGCRRWFNLARHVIERAVSDARIVDLSVPAEPN